MLLLSCQSRQEGTEPPTTTVYPLPDASIRPSGGTEPAPLFLKEFPEEPAIPLDDWRMILVNRTHPIPEGYEPELSSLSGGMMVDSRCLADLTAMLDACRAAGHTPTVCSAYRTVDTQTTLYEDKIRSLCRKGMTYDEAAAEAGTIVAVPGTSEHHLGLAVDIVDSGYQHLTTAQENTPVQQWLMAHSWEYGFILRYPNGKSHITGIIYEPWHYRYVGREAAADITARELCLEEYLALFQ